MDMTAEQLQIEEVVRTFEVYTSRYSKIVQAHGIVDALQKFLNENGGEKVICIEDVDYASIKTKELEEENKRLKSKVGILQRLSDRQKSTIIKWIEEYNIPPIKSGLDPTLDIFNQH